MIEHQNTSCPANLAAMKRAGNPLQLGWHIASTTRDSGLTSLPGGKIVDKICSHGPDYLHGYETCNKG